jgi:hypothetical protein
VDSRGFRYKKDGWYERKDGRRVPRYQCLSCRKRWSKQTFAVTYYLKRPELMVPIASGLVNGAAHRQIARSLHCAPSTVTRQSARLGRHSLLLLVLALQHLHEDQEDTVLDHAESFEGSQNDPFAIATLVGSRSWFWYGLEGSRHERTGRRTRFQEAKRSVRPRRGDGGGYCGSARRLLETRARFAGRTELRVFCDDKHDYARAVRSSALRDRIRLVVFPNPERGAKGAPRSAAALARDAAMFPNDLLHALMRHSMAHHHRETIAFPRRINAGLERLFLMSAWRNFVKKVSERRPERITPAMRKKVTSSEWSWQRVFARRLFPDRLPVPPSWLEIYRRDWTTPALASNTRHTLRLAF